MLNDREQSRNYERAKPVSACMLPKEQRRKC
jgi:hypothetical protein